MHWIEQFIEELCKMSGKFEGGKIEEQLVIKVGYIVFKISKRTWLHAGLEQACVPYYEVYPEKP